MLSGESSLAVHENANHTVSPRRGAVVAGGWEQGRWERGVSFLFGVMKVRWCWWWHNSECAGDGRVSVNTRTTGSRGPRGVACRRHKNSPGITGYCPLRGVARPCLGHFHSRRGDAHQSNEAYWTVWSERGWLEEEPCNVSENTQVAFENDSSHVSGVIDFTIDSKYIGFL